MFDIFHILVILVITNAGILITVKYLYASLSTGKLIDLFPQFQSNDFLLLALINL
jgi:hypothetical protein